MRAIRLLRSGLSRAELGLVEGWADLVLKIRTLEGTSLGGALQYRVHACGGALRGTSSSLTMDDVGRFCGAIESLRQSHIRGRSALAPAWAKPSHGHVRARAERNLRRLGMWRCLRSWRPRAVPISRRRTREARCDHGSVRGVSQATNENAMLCEEQNTETCPHEDYRTRASIVTGTGLVRQHAWTRAGVGSEEIIMPKVTPLG